MTDRAKKELLVDVLVNFLDSYQTITADIKHAVQKAGGYSKDEIDAMIKEAYEIHNCQYDDIPF